MPSEGPGIMIPVGRSAEERLNLLVQEARGLQEQSFKFAMLCLAGATLKQAVDARPEQAQQILSELSSAWFKLRHSQRHALHGFHSDLSDLMGGAFTREVVQNFDHFDAMARSICTTLMMKKPPDPEMLNDLVAFVSVELSETFEAVVEVANQVFEAGRGDGERIEQSDTLTGLPNRLGLMTYFQRIETVGWPQSKIVVMRLDLDHLRHLNHRFGHAAGDAALMRASQCLQSHAHKEDFLARIGSDEFVLVRFSEVQEDLTDRLADDLIDRLAEPFSNAGKDISVQASAGIAFGKQSDRISLEHYLNRADRALDLNKHAKSAAHQPYMSVSEVEQGEETVLQAEIRSGIEAGQFVPFFQPQVDGRSGNLVGFETLARWLHPTRGLLEPVDFLDAAEDFNLLDTLDNHLFERTLVLLRGWLDAGLQVPQVSINIAESRLLRDDLVDTLSFAVDRADLHPSMIGVEILESSMVGGGASRSLANVKKLSKNGFIIELDDYGTGLSSIPCLRDFQVDRIKIDRSFIKELNNYTDSSSITATMIGLAHTLRIDVLAEGVETPEERLVLNALGCDHMQGFGVSRPMAPDAVPNWIERTQTTRKLPSRKKRGFAQSFN